MDAEIRTLDLSDDLVNVVLVVGLAIVGDAELSIGGLGGAITVWEVVDDDLEELLLTRGLAKGTRVRQVLLKISNLGDRVYMKNKQLFRSSV